MTAQPSDVLPPLCDISQLIRWSCLHYMVLPVAGELWNFWYELPWDIFATNVCKIFAGSETRRSCCGYAEVSKFKNRFVSCHAQKVLVVGILHECTTSVIYFAKVVWKHNITWSTSHKHLAHLCQILETSNAVPRVAVQPSRFLSNLLALIFGAHHHIARLKDG